MSRYLRIFSVSLLVAGLWGCGDDAKKDDKAPANNAGAGGGPPGGGGPMMPGGPPGGMPGMPGMPGRGGPGGGAAAAAPADKTAAADSGGSGTSLALLQYMPEDIQVAAGASISTISDKATPFREQLMNQFHPVLAMLEGASITPGQIDQLWSGTSRDKGDMVICVRTKADYNAPAVTKALGATGAIEKVGKANLRRVPKNPDFNNAVAYVDSKTLLLGRYDTVVAALKNPKPGSIRAGLDALGQPKAMFWISGANDDSVKKLYIRGFEGLNWFIKGAPKPRGMAMSITNETDAAAKAGGGQGGPPGMPGGPPGGMPGGPPGGMPGPPGGMPGMPGMPGGGGGGGATSTRPIEIRVAWSFTSEAASNLMKELLQSFLDALNEANKSAGGGPPGPGGMPPGGPPGGPGGPPGGPGGPPGGPGGMGPGGRGGPGGGGMGRGRGRGRGLEVNGFEDFFQQGGPPGGRGGPPGGMPGQPGMGGDDANVTYYRIENTNENLKLIYHIPKDDASTVTKLLDRVLAASGVPALDDGLFQGTLSTLNKGIYGWEAAKPDPLIGMRRMGPQMAVWAGYSWMTELLPYVGYEPLYGKFDFSQTWAAVYNIPYAQVVVPAFLNPADPRASWDGRGPPLAATHFAGMSGIEERRNEVAAELPRTDPRAGIFGYDKIARLNEITDGAGQTIMMIGTGEVVAPWVQGGGATIRGARQPYFDKFTGFGSRGVKSGAYVMFADGSARVISANIDPEIFKAMCTMHGSEQIDMGKLVGQGGK